MAATRMMPTAMPGGTSKAWLTRTAMRGVSRNWQAAPTSRKRGRRAMAAKSAAVSVAPMPSMNSTSCTCDREYSARGYQSNIAPAVLPLLDQVVHDAHPRVLGRVLQGDHRPPAHVARVQQHLRLALLAAR